ncbi:hypothetical protein MKW92_012852 [Papaver armeniacum]|nr:hypothetical protein MKW92_012852 [Papaver armeniacum]
MASDASSEKKISSRLSQVYQFMLEAEERASAAAGNEPNLFLKLPSISAHSSGI